MTIQERIQKVEGLKEKVTEHCMCFDFQDLGRVYRVIYPIGFCVDGIQTNYAEVGKVVALEKILDRMGKDWKESFPGWELEK